MNNWARHFDQNGASAGPEAGRLAPTAQYFAFLSYSHSDSADADWLHSQLERFRVPANLAGKLSPNGVIPSKLTPIFRDLHELAAGDDLGTEIREALEASHCLIILCSPAAASSKWTNAEIELFKRLHPEGCMIAAIVAGEPFASEIKGREPEECLPPALRQKYDRRGRPTGRRAEPLAADLRDVGDGRRLGFLKIVAGLLGIGLDELVQRDQMRRQRRLATISAASLVGMIVAAALAVTAVQARDNARDERREAEGLVAFMLGDLKDKLEPIGRLDALDGVGSRVLDYYSRQDTSDLSDEALLQRSRALSLTAEVAYLRGDVDTARRLYREAMQGTGEAVSRDSDDPQRLYDHAQNVFWIGELARRRGQTAEAETAYREYKRLADQMVAIEPDNLKWRMEAAYGDMNVGIIFRNQRRFDDAARQFTSALGLIQNVASIDAHAEYQRELANVLGWLADAERDRGNIAAAIRIRQREVDFLRQLLAGGAANVNFRERLSWAHQGLGMLLSSTGEPESGLEQLRFAVAEADRLTGIEPDNTYWKGLEAQARLELARTLFSHDRSAEAAAEARAGCDLAAQVLARDSGPAWRRLQTACLALKARLAIHAGGNANALRLAERSLASARTERSDDRTRDRYSIAAAYRLVGDVHQRMGDPDAAQAAWIAGISQLPTNVAERPAEMNERAELLRRIGRAQETRPLTERLSAIGYRSNT